MHQVLVHSAALVAANESTGLGSLSDEPLEHNNKNIRNYRERKMTQHANLSDVLTQLWSSQILSLGVLEIKLNAHFVAMNIMYVLVLKSK